MAHVVIIPTTAPITPIKQQHDLPPFAAVMLILFGVYVVWLLIGGIVLFIIR